MRKAFFERNAHRELPLVEGSSVQKTAHRL